MEAMDESDGDEMFINKRIACVAVIGQNVSIYSYTLGI